jgi:hypothetical protein
MRMGEQAWVQIVYRCMRYVFCEEGWHPPHTHTHHHHHHTHTNTPTHQHTHTLTHQHPYPHTHTHVCSRCLQVRTATCCGPSTSSDNDTSFLHPATYSDDCPSCGEPLTPHDNTASVGGPAVSVGKRTGRVLRPPSKPKPLLGGLLNAAGGADADAAASGQGCAQCREWRMRHRQLASVRRSLRISVPAAALTPERLVAEAAYVACVSVQIITPPHTHTHTHTLTCRAHASVHTNQRYTN